MQLFATSHKQVTDLVAVILKHVAGDIAIRDVSGSELGYFVSFDEGVSYDAEFTAAINDIINPQE